MPNESRGPRPTCYESLTLEVLDFTMQIPIPYRDIGAYTRGSMEMRAEIDPRARHLVLQMRAKILAESLGYSSLTVSVPYQQTVSIDFTASFDVPATWWQHFKLAWFPDWLLKKYPVRYETIKKNETKTDTIKGTATKIVTIEHLQAYPKINSVFPLEETQHHIAYIREKR